MRGYSVRIVLLALGMSPCFGSGCSSAEPEQVPVARPQIYQLDGPIDIALADLLSQPRSQLAAQWAELTEQIRLQEITHREGGMPFNLLPDFHLPLAVPVFREAKYSPQLQMSLPPYMDGVKKDDVIALHLGRYGDTEGALKLVGQLGDSVLKQIEESRYEKSYPVEWIRLVALQLHVAQARLATGNEEGGRLLVALHKQLQTVLDPKARAGLLGATLLPRGRAALSLAAEAWRKTKQTELADQADALLAQWGKAPSWKPPFPSGLSMDEAARFFGCPGKGYALAVTRPERAFDLMGLPLPNEGVGSVIAAFNGDRRLAEIMLVYQPHIFMIAPKPEHLGELLEDWGAAAKDLPDTGIVKRRFYSVGEAHIEIAMIPDHTAVGCLVRLGFAGVSTSTPALDRVLGSVSLDDSFEQNRIRFAQGQKGTRLTVDRREDLKALAGLMSPLEPAEATLESDPAQRVVTRFSIQFAPERQGGATLGQLVLPLVEKGGPPHLEASSSKQGYVLALVWDDRKTRYVLTLPHGKRQGARLEVVDETASGDLEKHAGEVAARDRAERRQRIQDNKPLARIAREREKLRLGMTEAEVGKALPQGEGFTQRRIPGGLSLAIEQTPEKSEGFIPREVFVRFGPDKRVAEIRARYVGQAGVKNGLVKLLEKIQSSCGVPQKLTGSWATAWADYPSRKPAPILYRWEDDVTILTCQRDSEGAEVALLDRPADHENGLDLGRFQCVSEGPKNCVLGTTKAALLATWKDSKPVFEDNVLILTPPEDSPFSQIQAYFEERGSRVNRVVALYREKWEKDPGQDKLEEAVQGAWEKEKSSLGVWRRVELTEQGKLQSLTNHDDARRVCIFWQETKGGPRLYEEWTLLRKAKE